MNSYHDIGCNIDSLESSDRNNIKSKIDADITTSLCHVKEKSIAIVSINQNGDGCAAPALSFSCEDRSCDTISGGRNMVGIAR